MEFVTGVKQKETLEISDILAEDMIGKEVKLNGAIHTIRDMGDVAFVVLRKREGLVQTVFEQGVTDFDLKELKEAATIEVVGTVAKEDRAPNGVEVRLKSIRVLSEPTEPMPIPIGKWKLNTSLETKLALRPISLRNVRERAKFKIQEGIVRGFREFLQKQGFTEIRTPKICAKGAEGGANLFKMEYFHKPAVLAQSPQFYKQMMVGVFDRVFETGPVFRAEKHNTKRHINEYTSLDFEMGYIDSFEDIMAMETGFLQYTMELLQKEYAKELKMLGVQLPKTDKIPFVRFDEAKKLVSEKYNRTIKNPFDLEPEEEVLISQYFKEEADADFVFVTHYPSKKRPFYAMDDPADNTYTLSFDLLFRGMEITTGGQRIHDYNMLVDKIAKRGMSEEGMEAYMSIFKHGMPPHGGLGLGLERLTMKLLGEENVRETTMFPRDLSRLEP
ncbi:MAG: aspartate--tRNA(Asn) ligase [Lachnospiraceae bacterium]|nr:aspartate--tRNA(Asn) ligase [Lachnospiraceae bacterium]MEE1341203.1 aspartate--tRNA(Asn) ligase [Lachnospiraceae bacterium]